MTVGGRGRLREREREATYRDRGLESEREMLTERERGHLQG